MPHVFRSPARARPTVAGAACCLALAGVLACLAVFAAPKAHAADPARYKTYYDTFDRGGALIPGTDTAWVPQGLIYWPEQDALVISYYDSGQVQNSRLAIIDRDSGVRRKILVLPEKGHVGGLGMAGGYLWVASDDGISRYKKGKLASTPEGKVLPRAAGSPFPLAAKSYMTTIGRKLWVGSFDDDVAYRYTLDAAGIPRADNVSIRTPNETQGMVVAGGRYIFSRSYGRDDDSTIEVAGVRTINAPNMSEGIAVAKGELRVVYESGSAFYGDADYRVKTVHRAPLSRVLNP